MTTFEKWLPINLTNKDVIYYVGTFVVYLLSVKLSQYLLYTFETSPAVIWPPIGIAIVAMILGGRRMWLPIFLAHYIAFISVDGNSHQLGLLLGSAYALQAIAALFVLERLNLKPHKATQRNMFSLIIVAFLVTLIAPALTTSVRFLTGTLAVDPFLNITRAWGAGIFSVLVIVPFITLWYRWPIHNLFPTRRILWWELAAGFTLLIIINYLLFWTNYLQFFGISIIFFLPIILIWFALRMHPRWVALAIFIIAAQGILGVLLAQTSPNPISERLLSVQVYIGFVAAIFLIFAAVVHERRMAYSKLKKAYHATLISDHAKNDFIAILAHELRNPLAPIVSSLELLKLEPLTEESKQIINSVEDHAAMMRRLLDDLLDTVRLSQNKFALKKENLGVREIVEKSMDSVREFMESQHHTMDLTTKDGAEDITVYADPVRLKQILINLLNNAAKYTPPGGTINISYGIKGNEVHISVKDTGRGIERGKLENIFEPFKQFSVANQSQRGTGLGIGLFITKKLIEMHNGSIEAYSQGKDKGSMFSVRLPIIEAAPVEVPAPSPVTDRALKILLVDDNLPLITVLEKLLTRYGHVIETAHSGEEALTKVPTFRPDVIFLDIGLPEMDGYETGKRIRQLGWRGILVALTGYGQVSDREKSQDAGFDHHLVKPVGIADLNQILVEVKGKPFSGDLPAAFPV